MAKDILKGINKNGIKECIWDLYIKYRGLCLRVSEIEDDNNEEDDVDSIKDLRTWYNKIKNLTFSHINHQSTAVGDNNPTWTATADNIYLNYDCFSVKNGHPVSHDVQYPVPVASATQAGVITSYLYALIDDVLQGYVEEMSGPVYSELINELVSSDLYSDVDGSTDRAFERNDAIQLDNNITDHTFKIVTETSTVLTPGITSDTELHFELTNESGHYLLHSGSTPVELDINNIGVFIEFVQPDPNENEYVVYLIENNNTAQILDENYTLVLNIGTVKPIPIADKIKDLEDRVSALENP